MSMCAHGGQKRVHDPLGLELGGCRLLHRHARDWASSPAKAGHPMFFTSVPSLQACSGFWSLRGVSVLTLIGEIRQQETLEPFWTWYLMGNISKYRSTALALLVTEWAVFLSAANSPHLWRSSSLFPSQYTVPRLTATGLTPSTPLRGQHHH